MTNLWLKQRKSSALFLPRTLQMSHTIILIGLETTPVGRFLLDEVIGLRDWLNVCPFECLSVVFITENGGKEESSGVEWDGLENHHWLFDYLA